LEGARRAHRGAAPRPGPRLRRPGGRELAHRRGRALRPLGRRCPGRRSGDRAGARRGRRRSAVALGGPAFPGGRLPRARRRGRRGAPVSLDRIRAVVRKEVREFRRNRFVIGTMGALPVVFLITPLLTIFRIPSSASGTAVRAAVGTISLLLLIVPVVLPPVIAAYSVVGEREQGTLEPLLTAPVRASELLVGKAVAAFLPAVGLAYAIYAVVLVGVRVGAAPVVRDVFFHPPQLVAQLLFAPLLALYSIWVGIGISTRVSDVRVAQQLATLAGLPLLAFTSLLSFQLLRPTVPLAAGLALALLALDTAAARVVSRLFDPERLLTGRPGRGDIVEAR